MNQAMIVTLLGLIPLGLAMTFSTVPISFTILVLLSPNRPRIAVPYLIGWVSGIAFIVAVFTFVIRVASPDSWSQGFPSAPWAEILLGLVLIAYAIVAFLLRRRRRRSAQPRRWVRMALSLNRITAFTLAVALSLRPKSLLLIIAAAVLIVSYSSTPLWILLAIAVFTVVSSGAVAGTVSYTLLYPSRAQKALGVVHRWIVAHGAFTSQLVALVTGVALAAYGVWQL